ncbi:hypothetical protein [Aliarcobacter cryaerophilus]|nr:hypothetical protein [Aliarcobacter cryaerophilus]MCT7525503.1 hypothetical protein [Aliarcobacter cryaerophilus]
MDNFKDFDEFTEEKKEAFYKLVGKNVRHYVANAPKNKPILWGL